MSAKRKWDVHNVNGRYLSIEFVVSDEKTLLATLRPCANPHNQGPSQRTSILTLQIRVQLYLSSCSSTLNLDNDEIPAIIKLKAKI
ncbi:hypothetical protein Tco_1412072, partial [Tanacetum coccineum]